MEPFSQPFTTVQTGFGVWLPVSITGISVFFVLFLIRIWITDGKPKDTLGYLFCAFSHLVVVATIILSIFLWVTYGRV